MMGFLPDQCLYIDDTSKGVNMGVAAGIQTIHFALSCDYKQSASTCLTSMSDVIKHIESIRLIFYSRRSIRFKSRH